MNNAAIEARVAALEASNRRLRRGMLALALGVVVLTGIGANLPGGVPKEIRAKLFVAVDDAGRPLVLVGRNPSSPSQGCVVVSSASPAGICAFLSGSETGEGLLNISGNGGLSGVTLTGHEVTLNGEGGNRAVSLTANDRGEGWCGTFNDRGQELVTLGAMEGGEGMVRTLNAKGQEIVSLGASVDGKGMVTTRNAKGQEVVSLGATTEGDGVVRTLNAKGQELVRLGASDSGGAVATWNGKGQEMVTLGTTDSGGGVQVSNKTGQAVCKMMVDEYGNGFIGVSNRYGEDARALSPGP